MPTEAEKMSNTESIGNLTSALGKIKMGGSNYNSNRAGEKPGTGATSARGKLTSNLQKPAADRTMSARGGSRSPNSATQGTGSKSGGSKIGGGAVRRTTVFPAGGVGAKGLDGSMNAKKKE